MMLMVTSVLTYTFTQYQHMWICWLLSTSWNSRGQMHSAHVMLVKSMACKARVSQSIMCHLASQGLQALRNTSGTLTLYQCNHNNDMTPCLKTSHLKQPRLHVMIYINIMESHTSVRYAKFHL